MQNRSYVDQVSKADTAQSFLMQVYAWMSFGLLVTGFLAYYTASTPAVLQAIFGNKIVFYGLLIIQIGLVLVISGAINSLSASMASFLFFIYSALNGFSLGSIFLLYTYESIALVFFITAGTFAIMSIYGYVTKTDLSKFGSILFMLLIGIVLASLVNIFMKSTALMWITTYIGIFVFVGLTAYDTQKLKNMSSSLEKDSDNASKLSVLGALILYLDFINMFLLLLRVFGRRR